MTKRPERSTDAPPRSIRDIAHLYLSREARAPDGATIVVIAENRECMAGFHVANLVAALCVREVSTHLCECSGTIPNAAYYFAQPPEVYLRSRRAELVHRVLRGVTLSFGCRHDGSGAEGDARMRIVHAPSLELERPAGEWIPARRNSNEPTWLISIGGAPSQSALGPLRVSRRFQLRVDQHSTPRDEMVDLGRLAPWRHSLCDRLAAVLRDDGGALARDYLGITDSLLSQLTTYWRRSHGPRARVEGGARRGRNPRPIGARAVRTLR